MTDLPPVTQSQSNDERDAGDTTAYGADYDGSPVFWEIR